MSSQYMRTPLFEAVCVGHLDVVLLLLDHGADADEECYVSHRFAPCHRRANAADSAQFTRRLAVPRLRECLLALWIVAS